MTSPSQVGFQPRTTPGERRADIDLRRKIAAINANLPDLSDYYTKSEADAQFLTESEADALFLTQSEADALFLTQSEADTRYVNTSGDTLTGALTLAGNPTTALQATPKQYVDARTDASRFTSTGVALSGTYSGEATVNTLNFTLPVASYIHFTGILFVSKTVAGDRHLVNCYLDGSGTAFNQIALLGLTQMTAYFSYSASLAAGAHTILVRMIRDAGTGNAQVFADSRSNRTDLLAVPS